MVQRLRAPHWTAGAALAAAALLATVPACATSVRVPAAAVRESPGPGAPGQLPEVDGEVVPEEAYEELAGSAGGVGREHPGRPANAPADPEVTTVSRPLHPVRPAPRPERPERPERRERPTTQRPTAPASPAPSPAPSGSTPVSALGTEPNERIADLAAHLLPLGTGLALMGVGLGYMGVRLRRGR
ncbi:hypothetical protein AB0469_27715 [Streptomyces sp. NPDC093801]|uniref:hypothetical protein n=1 Tax=Streptomyces sp. NPDC093801 TaxID=3155203 RepID=UPI00344CFB87